MSVNIFFSQLRTNQNYYLHSIYMPEGHVRESKSLCYEKRDMPLIHNSYLTNSGTQEVALLRLQK